MKVRVLSRRIASRACLYGFLERNKLETMLQGFGRVRLSKGKLFLLSLVAGFFIWAVMVIHPFCFNTSIVQHQLLPAFLNQTCQQPKLDAYNPLLLKHIKDVGEMTCNTEHDWVYLANGYLHINMSIAKKYGKISCTVNLLTRTTDFKNSLGPNLPLSSDTGKLKLEADFFYVKCVAADKRIWTDIMAGIHRNEKAVGRSESLGGKEGDKMNVLIFGLDSMSRLHYMRKMPKSYGYMTKSLDAIVLEGYNIVGDGTPQALIPILTSFTELELPETRKRMEGAKHVNVYPFIWKNFSANGYVTAFAEDTPSIGIFTYRLMGFGEQPTDHYMRAFYVEAEKEFKKHPKLCLGSIPRHKVMLDWLRQFYDVYRDVPKFAFGFHGELSHDDYNTAQYADGDILRFLQGLNSSGILDNTMLIIMSDHGHRFASIRHTQQGKQEERMPFFSIRMPPSFANRYPKLYRNLRLNAQRLTTPFDIYSTLAGVLNPSAVPLVANIKNRSVSLFSEITKERSCGDAFIEAHWCTCLQWEDLSTKDPTALQAAQSVVDFINEYTQTQSSLCARLSLDRLTRAERFLPNANLLKYKQNADKDGFVADLSDTMEASEVLYTVQLVAFPSGGVYEALVKHSRSLSSFRVQESEISRITMYGSQPHCVQEQYPNLRKYCYCKIQLS